MAWLLDIPDIPRQDGTKEGVLLHATSCFSFLVRVGVKQKTGQTELHGNPGPIARRGQGWMPFADSTM